MEFKSHIPIYWQIVDLIKRDFVTGKLLPGEKLESVRDYAQRIKVNPNTVQKAYQEMEQLGLVESRRGLGTFLTEDLQMREKISEELAQAYTAEYHTNMSGMGYTVDQMMDYLKTKINEQIIQED